MIALLVVLLTLAGPVIIPEGQPMPPWPAWACEAGEPEREIPTVCQFNHETRTRP